MTYDEIVDLLKNNDCEVTFTKVDGSTRVMPCTLRPEALPPKVMVESKLEKKPQTAVVSAYSLDNQGWRSFRITNIIDVKVINAK